MRSLTFREVRDFLYTRVANFSRQHHNYTFHLSVTRAFLQRLSTRARTIPVVHVGGTNGKGSVSSLCASILHRAGRTTGLYTSPHLYDLRERIQVNSQYVPEDFVCAFVQEHMTFIGEQHPSFFEIMTAMAWEYFAQQKVDVAVVEVGLGGRLDSTNICSAVVSVLTNVTIDHKHWLGEDVQTIAREKAGIAKKNIPLLLGRANEAVEAVCAEIAQQTGTNLHMASELVKWQNDDILCPSWIGETRMSLPVAGIADFQRENIRTAVAALSLLPDILRPHASSIATGVQHWTIPGRWQYISRKPDIVLDVGHNEDAARKIRTQIDKNNSARIHIVLGLCADKDVDGILSHLPQQAYYYCTQSSSARSLPASVLYNKVRELQRQADMFLNPKQAFTAAKKHINDTDLLLVTGSFFLIGDLG